MTPQQILKQYYGYDSFRPMQEEIVRHILSGRDALVLMPTGGGKSICFQIPALMMEGTAVVVSPLISLMKDQVEALQANGIEAAALNSAGDTMDNRIIRERCMHGDIKLLYISPERLMAEIPWLQQYVKVSMFAIDEAHCISQWGHDFRPEYTQLGALHENFPGVPIVALTATADKLTKTDIVEQLALRDPEIFISSFDRPNLSLDVKRGYSANDKLRAMMAMIARHPHESGIVYCLSRKKTEQVAAKLKAKGVKVGVYHAGLSTTERDRVQEDFINDRIDVVVATIAFGMGIDKSNVRFVIHYNLPKSIESFYQEIGRGGRDGLPTETLLFYNIGDLITLRSFADESGQRDINLEKLKRMQEYAEAQVCRRRILLNYFGETSDCECGNCDVCTTPPERFDGTVIVQKALSAIVRSNEQIGFNVAIDILKGTYSPEVMAKGYQNLKTFGAGREISGRDWRDYLLQMLQMGFIEIAYNEDSHLKITPLGTEVLYGRKQADLAVIVREDLRVTKKRKEIAPIIDLTPATPGKEDKALFEALRTLRWEIAKEESRAPYLIMGDKTLHELATTKPTNLLAFGNTFGIAKRKTEAYGERFLSVIRQYCQEVNVLITDETTAPKTKLPVVNGHNEDDGTDAQIHIVQKQESQWTEEDELALHLSYVVGCSLEHMQNAFGKSKKEISLKLKQLGLDLDGIGTLNFFEKKSPTNYMEEQKQLHKNAYAKWTKEDDLRLQQLYEDGVSIKELMELFERNRGSIISRLKKLGLR